MARWFVKFWGVRGSIPVPGARTLKYGGNTSCHEIYTEEGDRVVFDAGSGIFQLGRNLDLSKRQSIPLFITHPHWDHINGLPLFPPIFIPGNEITVYGPRTYEMSLEDIIEGQMKYTYFPVRVAELHARFSYVEMEDAGQVTIGPFQITARKLNHPVDCLGYRVEYSGRTFIYLGDNEPYYNVYRDGDREVERTIEEMNEGLVDFVRDADLLITDSQYTPAEYEKKRGFGHSSTHHSINMALRAGVKRLFLNHHDPERSDEELDRIVDHYRERLKKKGHDMELAATREGEIVEI